MLDFLKIVLSFYFIPFALLYILSRVYQKLLLKEIAKIKTQTNHQIEFICPKECDKITFFVERDLEDFDNREDFIEKNRFKVVVNGNDLSEKTDYFWSVFILEMPTKALLVTNSFKVIHDQTVPLVITVQGDKKRVRQTVALALVGINVVLVVIIVAVLLQVFSLL